jgi:hypothetical protein
MPLGGVLSDGSCLRRTWSQAGIAKSWDCHSDEVLDGPVDVRVFVRVKVVDVTSELDGAIALER